MKLRSFYYDLALLNRRQQNHKNKNVEGKLLVPPGKCFPRSLAILALRARIVIPPKLLAAFFSTFSFKVFSTLFSNLFCMLLSKVFSIFFAKVLSTLLCQRCLTFFAKVLSTLLFTLRTKQFIYDKTKAKIFWYRGYKLGYINRSLKSLWLHFGRPFNGYTCCIRFWQTVS